MLLPIHIIIWSVIYSIYTLKLHRSHHIIHIQYNQVLISNKPKLKFEFIFLTDWNACSIILKLYCQININVVQHETLLTWFAFTLNRKNWINWKRGTHFWLWSAWKDLYEQNLLLLLFISFIMYQNCVMIPWGSLNLNLYWVYSLISMDSWSWYWWSIISYINIIERHTFAIVMMHVAASFHAMDPRQIPCSSKAIFYICHHHRSVYFRQPIQLNSVENADKKCVDHKWEFV